MTGDQVKRVTVEAARQNIIDNYIEDGWELPILNAHLDDLVAAVREDERERVKDAAFGDWADGFASGVEWGHQHPEEEPCLP